MNRKISTHMMKRHNRIDTAEFAGLRVIFILNFPSVLGGTIYAKMNFCLFVLNLSTQKN